MKTRGRGERRRGRALATLAIAALLLPAVAWSGESTGAAPPAESLVQASQRDDGPIEDNSFLIEEAYNQERGVVQHISSFTRPTDGRGWVYSFTEEWPISIQKHQLSLTLIGASVADRQTSHAGLGDAALNYRYQLLGRGHVWLAPRLSLLAPTGDAQRGLGSGGWGLQLNVPLSVRAARRLVAHSNAGASWVARADGSDGRESDTQAFNLGQSLIWLASPRLNVMLEATWSSYDEVADGGRTVRRRAAFVSPGLRLAIDVKGGLQIVPGIGFPVGVGPSRGERSLLFYLSFEHPLALLGH